MLRRIAGLASAALVFLFGSAIAAGPPLSPLWSPVDDDASLRASASRAHPFPLRYRAHRLDRPALSELLSRAPREFTEAARSSPPIIELPMPDGSLARFTFEESPIVEPGLAEKFPELKTYRAQGIDDPAATARFDWLPSGFHAMVLAPSGTVIIDPHSDHDVDHYITYRKRDAVRTTEPFVCHVTEDEEPVTDTERAGAKEAVAISSGILRTYRLALAATNEYAAAVGGNTVSGTLSAQVLVMNRVNGVFERELGIRMVMIANNNLIVYAGNNTSCSGGSCNSSNDPYTNSDGATMLGQNTTTLNSVIGSANYDIGHVFSTGGGGIATLSGVCGTNKARGVTGLSNPVGDPFAIDYVAHEMGHQWGAAHTFNGTSGSCGGNRSNGSAYEVGSGITIMGYSGICAAQNLANFSIDNFHVKSLESMAAFSQTGNGNTCAVQTGTGNSAPNIAGPGSFTIPKQTPFALTATGSDPDGDAITYDWQEYDLDLSGAGTTATPNTDADGTARPIFRPYSPSVNPTRTFPSLQYILNNANVPPTTTGSFLTGELLPAISRTMTFKVVARDNRANGGGVNSATTTITVDGASGPFAVTSPNTSVTVAPQSTLVVTWNVAGTSGAPVSAANVKISLSTDGGNTFPHVLSASTPNDGSQSITLPNVETTAARIKVEAVGNIFFDVSDVNFAISGSPPPPPGGTLDVDLSAPSLKYDALTDGLLVVRYLFGLTGPTLTNSATSQQATRTDPNAIVAYLNGIRPSLDIDGNGSIDALTDGLLIVRYMIGLRGDALVNGIPIGGKGGVGRTLTEIETYLQSLMP